VHVTRIGSRHVIEGWVQDEKELALVNHIAGLYPGQVESLVRIGVPVPTGGNETAPSSKRFLIRIDFYFVELDTSSTYAVGIGWPGSIGGANVLQGQGALDLLTGQVTQAAITVNQPLPRLDIAATHGWGRVLKHVTVVTNSGSEAKFTSGGEQNFLANTGLTVGLQKVTYGVQVTVVPRFDPSRHDLELKLGSEVSDLTAAGPGTSLPGRTQSTLDTVVNTRIGQSIVLSGVHVKAQTHSVSGLPLLSQIPVLGLFFGSHQNSATESEGAIYIVPSVIESVDKSSMELVDEAVRQFNDFDGSLGDVHLLGERPPAVAR
jgi:pilus assembly protein CpaC